MFLNRSYWLGQSLHVSIYLVSVKLDSAVLKDKAHLLEFLHGAGGTLGFFSHFQASKLFNWFMGFGSVIQVKACVIVTNHTSGLK